jgi:hypothetical protein
MHIYSVFHLLIIYLFNVMVLEIEGKTSENQNERYAW